MKVVGRMKKKHYSIVSNIAYALKNIWKWDKVFYLYFSTIGVCAVFMPLASTYFPKLLIEQIQSQEEIKTILQSIIGYFIVLLIVRLLDKFCDSRLTMRQYELSTLYQHAIMQKHMRTDFAHVDNPEFAIKYQHAYGDATSGQCAPEFIWRSLLGLLISVLGIVTYGTIITSFSLWLIILLSFSSVVTYAIGYWHRMFIEKHKDKWAAIDRKIEYLRSFSKRFEYAKDIRIYNMGGWILDRLAHMQGERLFWIKKENKVTLSGKVIGALLLLLQNGVAYFVLLSMIVNREIDVGDFVFYFGIVSGFSVWLNGVVDRINDIVHKSIKINYYRDYFEIEEQYNHGSGCVIPKLDAPISIDIENVSYAYPSDEGVVYALKNINLHIREGEKLAIVGANGAGKTTLVKMLCGLYYPTEGHIKLNDRLVAEYNIEDYYTLFSVVFQDLYLLPVTLREFIASSTENIDDERLAKSIYLAGLEQKIRKLPNGINSKLMKGVFDDSIELSGGEKQKLLLARALYKDAPMIILDEPTASLDPMAEKEVYEKYSVITKNKTSIYISHRLASTRFCDRIIFLKEGEIIECGSHEELMKLGGEYAQMYALQGQYYKEEKAKNV